jgi:hypothetical protein
VPNFEISRDETLDNKPIVFVRKRVKIYLRQCRIPKFSGRTPGAPAPRERKGREGKSGREKRGGEERGRGWGGKKGRGGREGLKEREGMERGGKGGGKVRGIWTPDLPDRSTPLFRLPSS